jgi:hypothetical protein
MFKNIVLICYYYFYSNGNGILLDSPAMYFGCLNKDIIMIFKYIELA